MSFFDDVFYDLTSDLIGSFSDKTISLKRTERVFGRDGVSDDTVTTYQNIPVLAPETDIGTVENIAEHETEVFVAAKDLVDSGVADAPRVSDDLVTMDGIERGIKRVEIVSGDSSLLYKLTLIG